VAFMRRILINRGASAVDVHCIERGEAMSVTLLHVVLVQAGFALSMRLGI
jgi:hypothetical protein